TPFRRLRLIAASCFPLPTSQTRTGPLQVLEASSRQLTQIESEDTLCVDRQNLLSRSQLNLRIGLPLGISQIRTVPSHPPEASVFPSGVTARVVTQAWCPSGRCNGRPLEPSNTRTTPSSPPIARYLPSCEYAAAFDLSQRPSSSFIGLPLAASHTTARLLPAVMNCLEPGE